MHRLLLTVAASALALAGCGSGESDTAGSDPSTDAANDTATTAPPSTAPADAEESASGSRDEPAAVPDVLDFSAETLDGQTFDGASVAGSPSVFWFWAPWCPTCQGEGPAVAEAADELGDQATIVGVAGLSEDKDAMESFVERTGTDDVTHLDDRDGDLYREFGVATQSTYVVVAADGTTTTESGPLSADDITALVADAS